MTATIATAETLGPQQGQRLDSLTGLRFIAAFVVFGIHSLYYGQGSWAENIFAAGMTGVSFFYIVSGFVLAWTARKHDSVRHFYQRRFARIYPAYVVAWLVSLGILLTSGRPVGLIELIPLTLLQSWVPAEAVYFAANAVFWSLSCEAFFYLVFPFLYRRMFQWGSRKLLVVGAILVLLVLTIAVAVSLTGTTAFGIWVAGFFPPTRLCEFVLGMILALLLRRGLPFAVPLWIASALALVAYAIANIADDPYSRVIVTLVPFCLLIWSAAQADLGHRPSVLRAKPLVTLGVWSYSFYLIHTQAMTAAFEVMDRIGIDTHQLSGWWLFAAVCASLVCAITAAAALHHFVEAPLEKRLRGQRPRVTA